MIECIFTLDYEIYDLGDVRLNARAGLLLSRFGDNPLASIPAACNGWSETKAAYRFLSHERVTPDNILEPHFQATHSRYRGGESCASRGMGLFWRDVALGGRRLGFAPRAAL